MKTMNILFLGMCLVLPGFASDRVVTVDFYDPETGEVFDTYEEAMADLEADRQAEIRAEEEWMYQRSHDYTNTPSNDDESESSGSMVSDIISGTLDVASAVSNTTQEFVRSGIEGARSLANTINEGYQQQVAQQASSSSQVPADETDATEVADAVEVADTAEEAAQVTADSTAGLATFNTEEVLAEEGEAIEVTINTEVGQSGWVSDFTNQFNNAINAASSVHGMLDNNITRPLLDMLLSQAEEQIENEGLEEDELTEGWVSRFINRYREQIEQAVAQAQENGEIEDLETFDTDEVLAEEELADEDQEQSDEAIAETTEQATQLASDLADSVTETSGEVTEAVATTTNTIVCYRDTQDVTNNDDFMAAIEALSSQNNKIMEMMAMMSQMMMMQSQAFNQGPLAANYQGMNMGNNSMMNGILFGMQMQSLTNFMGQRPGFNYLGQNPAAPVVNNYIQGPNGYGYNDHRNQMSMPYYSTQQQNPMMLQGVNNMSTRLPAANWGGFTPAGQGQAAYSPIAPTQAPQAPAGPIGFSF